MPDLKKDPPVAVPETLRFNLSEAPSEFCSEFKVVVRRERVRADKSARVAIERFVLVPK